MLAPQQEQHYNNLLVESCVVHCHGNIRSCLSFTLTKIVHINLTCAATTSEVTIL